MIQNVLVIDDRPAMANMVASTIENYQSKHSDVVYSVNKLYGPYVFHNALEFINGNLDSIDMVFVDYNLNEYFGTDILKEISKTGRKVYKVLHSHTTRSAHLAKEYKSLFEDFSKSKDAEDIINVMKHYENNIIDIKLYGHPVFRNKYLNGVNISREAKQLIYQDISFFDVLYTEPVTGKEQTRIYYRNRELSKTEVILKPKSAKKEYDNIDLFFKKVNGSLTINLLWVSYIDLATNTIKFIANNNEKIEKDFIITDLFKHEIQPLLPLINSGVDPFFII